MSMSTPPVGGSSPVEGAGNTDASDELTEEVTPTVAQEPSGPIAALPKRIPGGKQVEQSRTFKSPPPKVGDEADGA